MTDKVWTLAEEEELRVAGTRLNELKRRRANSSGNVYNQLKLFVDRAVSSHDLSLGEIVQLIVSNRWELVDILTEGEYSTLIVFRTLATEAANND